MTRPVELARSSPSSRPAVAVATVDPRAPLVLGCDSVLELDGAAFGKPDDADEGPGAVARDARPVRRAAHRARARRGGDGGGAATASTVVHFADLTDDEIDAYVATGEPLQVAGAFTVDGLGGAFVSGIEGDHHNVVGVSLPLLRDLLLSSATRGRVCGLPPRFLPSA